MWHEHPPSGARWAPRPQFAIDKDAAHRFVVHGLSDPRFRDDAPQRNRPRPVQKSTLRANAPAFVPDQVTQWALQMTGQFPPPPPMARPPIIPPDDVTHAAIQLSERVSRQQGRPIQPPSPQMILQNLLLQQQQQQQQQQLQPQPQPQQLFNQLPGAFPPFPGSPLNASLPTDGLSPVLRPNVPPPEFLPTMQGLRPFGQPQQRPEFARGGGVGFRPRGGRQSSDPRPRNKRKP